MFFHAHFTLNKVFISGFSSVMIKGSGHAEFSSSAAVAPQNTVKCHSGPGKVNS